MPTPKWLTGRTRTPVTTISFSIEVEWAPLVGTRVHYLKYGSVFAAVDSAYITAYNPIIGSGLRGPYVSITPEVRAVAGSSTLGASPYKPDSPEGYRWEPANDPGGGWVEVTNWPLHRVQFGWRVLIFGGDGSPLSGGGWIPQGPEITAWNPGGGAGSPGPMGGITYSSFGVPPGTPIPTGRTSWPAPDDWERTQGTTYSHTLSGTIVFNGGEWEEYFLNLDAPTALTPAATRPAVGHISEIGDRLITDPGPPWARQYTEQRAPGSTQSISVDCGAVGSWSITTAADGTMPNSNFLAPFGQATAFTHTLGTGGSGTSAATTLSMSLNAGGAVVTPIAYSYSNSDGTANQAGATATSFLVAGSTAYPTFPLFLPGGGQAYRGGIKIGNATTSQKIVIPETVVWSGQLHRLPDQVNDISYDLQIDAYQPSGGVAPTVLQTISGITSSFSTTFSYDNRAGFGETRLGSATTHANGGTLWSINKPSTWPANAGCRLAGANATGLPTRRLCIRGKKWTLYRAYAPNIVPIAPDSAGTWLSGRTDGPGMTSSIVSGNLRLVATSAAYTRLPIATPLPEYRLHKIRIRSIGSANQSLRVRRVGTATIPERHTWDWTISTGADGSWVEVDLDPLAAYPGPCHSISPGALPQNSAGWFWQFDTLGACTIEIEWLRAEVRTFARLDCIRRTMALDFYNLVGTVDGSPYSLALDSTDNLAGRHGGWSIEPETAPSASKPWGHDTPWNLTVDTVGPYSQADWYDADNFEYIAGAGLMRDSGTWSTYLNQGANEPAPELVGGLPVLDMVTGLPGLEPAHAIPAQELLERVILYPGCGDVLGYSGGAYGTSTTLHYGLLLGAAVHGLQLGEIEDGADWPDIVALDGSTERARGEALGAEHYALLSPDLRNGVSYSVRLDPEDDASQRLTIAGEDKRVFRTLWGLATLKLLSMAVSATQRVCRAWRATGGVLGLEFRRVGSPDTWEAATTSLSIPRGGCITYDQGSATQRLWIAYETSGGGIEARYSDDEGGSWSVATTITSSGRCPAACASPTQVRYFAWVVSGVVKVLGLDSQDNVVCPETTAVASGAANTGLAIVHDGELLHLTYQAAGGAQTSVKSTDGGLSWA